MNEEFNNKVNNNFDISLLQVNIHTPYKVTNNNADIKSDDVYEDAEPCSGIR